MSDYMDKSQLLDLLRNGAEILESPPINARLIFGFPDHGPTMWIDDKLQEMDDAEAIADLVNECSEIDRQAFKGKNGLTYYRYILKSAGE